jgi:ATP-binding cassette subfamily C (CFTR/MRP) protein 1
MIALGLFGVSLEIVSILIFKEYINTFEYGYEPFLEPTYLGIIFLAIKMIHIFNSRQMDFKQNYLGTKSSIELSCFIYDKVLKGSPASFQQKSSEGEIINFLQVDALRIAATLASSPTLFTIPIQIVSYTVMIFIYFGLSYLFGIATLIIFFAINLYITIEYSKISENLLYTKDDRMKITAEVFNSLKLFKLYGWEEEFKKRIENARNDELKIMKKYFSNVNLMTIVYWATPMFVSVITIGAYQHFTSEMRVADILTFITIFGYIQNSMFDLPWNISMLVNTLVSLKRIEQYLDQTEIDNSKLIRNDTDSMLKGNAIEVVNGNFTWGGLSNLENAESFVVNSENDLNRFNLNLLNNNTHIKIVLKNINLTVKQGEMVVIIGEVGSGKSSLFQAILNNMIIVNDKSLQPTKLIINGSVSYVSQSAWILNDTVKNNILFKSHYDADKYDKVIELCELTQDLQMLVGGDMTEIGEKGLNISGGQKARISIARAVYSDADIIMLDDSISALDAHVGQNIMSNCIANYMKCKTRILITHALQYLNYADRIIFMNNGEIQWTGTYDEIITQQFYNEFSLKVKTNEEPEELKVQKTEYFSEEEGEDEEIESEGEEEEFEEISIGNINQELVEKDAKEHREVKRITKDEHQDVGRVKLSIYLKYMKYLGGYWVYIIVIFFMLLWQGSLLSSDYYLTYWAMQKDEENNLSYYWKYSLLYFSSVLFNIVRIKLLSWGSLKCSDKLHTKMIDSLIKAPVNIFHDTVPKGQIFNRLSKDMNEIDTELIFHYNEFFVDSISILGIIILCSIIEPYCLINIPILVFGGLFILIFYIRGRRDLARIEGITRSPLLNLITETLPGTITIRAYEMQEIFMNKFYSRINDYFKVNIVTVGVSNWFSLHLDFLYFIFSVFLIVFSILFKDKFDSQSIGLMLSYSLLLEVYLFSLLNTVTLIENSMVSIERCLKFTDIPEEKPNHLPNDNRLASWPSEGKIEFRDYFVKYRPETETVLKNLNITINPKEKVGIVGRTGSGKSTLCLSLFRILEPLSGAILIDGVDITEVGLIKLRSSLTIIPQDPSLVEGTLRYNIDPIGNFNDEEIKKVMELIGFTYIIESSGGLDQIVNYYYDIR